jgi:hypothetical protein
MGVGVLVGFYHTRNRSGQVVVQVVSLELAAETELGLTDMETFSPEVESEVGDKPGHIRQR